MGELDIDLDISTFDLEPSKREKQSRRDATLNSHYSGKSFDIFTKILRVLSSAKVTKPGIFRSVLEDGYSIRCSYKADQGRLFPLDKALVYIDKPTLFIPFEAIVSLECVCPATNAMNRPLHPFDLIIHLKAAM